MKDKLYQVPAVMKALDILEFLATQREASFTQIYSELGIPKTSAYHILSTLSHRGYVRFSGDSARYCLGLKLFELGTRSVSRIDLRAEALPLLRDLVTRTNETCNLGIQDGVEGVYLAKLEGTQPVRLYSWEGKRMPLHCTAIGKALLAWQGKEEREEILKEIELIAYTKNTITEKKKLKKHLAMIRRRGWSIDDQENEPHVRCLGAPVLSVDGRILAAISVSGLATRFEGDHLKTLAKEVQRAARKLSEKVGGSLMTSKEKEQKGRSRT
jgi:DNA-binding IclR family transcriptional regulator